MSGDDFQLRVTLDQQVWRQTSNPVHAPVAGYEPIHVPCEMMVDSRATTAPPLARAFATFDMDDEQQGRKTVLKMQRHVTRC